MWARNLRQGLVSILGLGLLEGVCPHITRLVFQHRKNRKNFRNKIVDFEENIFDFSYSRHWTYLQKAFVDALKEIQPSRLLRIYFEYLFT